MKAKFIKTDRIWNLSCCGIVFICLDLFFSCFQTAVPLNFNRFQSIRVILLSVFTYNLCWSDFLALFSIASRLHLKISIVSRLYLRITFRCLGHHSIWNGHDLCWFFCRFFSIASSPYSSTLVSFCIPTVFLFCVRIYGHIFSYFLHYNLMHEKKKEKKRLRDVTPADEPLVSHIVVDQRPEKMGQTHTNTPVLTDIYCTSYFRSCVARYVSAWYVTTG